MDSLMSRRMDRTAKASMENAMSNCVNGMYSFGTELYNSFQKRTTLFNILTVVVAAVVFP